MDPESKRRHIRATRIVNDIAQFRASDSDSVIIRPMPNVYDVKYLSTSMKLFSAGISAELIVVFPDAFPSKPPEIYLVSLGDNVVMENLELDEIQHGNWTPAYTLRTILDLCQWHLESFAREGEYPGRPRPEFSPEPYETDPSPGDFYDIVKKTREDDPMSMPDSPETSYKKFTARLEECEKREKELLEQAIKASLDEQKRHEEAMLATEIALRESRLTAEKETRERNRYVEDCLSDFFDTGSGAGSDPDESDPDELGPDVEDSGNGHRMAAEVEDLLSEEEQIRRAIRLSLEDPDDLL